MYVTDQLAALVSQHTPANGDYLTAIPDLLLFKRDAPTEPQHANYSFGLGLVVQGSKRAMLGDHFFDYKAGQAVLISVDLPMVSYVTQASTDAPCMGLVWSVSPSLIISLALELDLPIPKKESVHAAWSVDVLDDKICDALKKLLQLLDKPHLIEHLAPLIHQEIAIRLLTGPQGLRLRYLALNESTSRKISQAVSWLKAHFKENIAIESLAAQFHMSPSAFRQHFKTIAGISPLQYQKQLRLQEARQLMINQNFDASSAALDVGYESVSQFNREYSRFFGNPPLRDIKHLRS